MAVEREEWKFDTLCDLYDTLTITQVGLGRQQAARGAADTDCTSVCVSVCNVSGVKRRG